MKIIKCISLLKSEKDFYFNKVLRKLNTFYDDRDGIYEEFDEYTLFFDYKYDLKGILKLDINLYDIDVKLLEVFQKGYGTKIVNYIKNIYFNDYDIYLSKVKKTSIGFWLKMGFHKINDESHFKYLKSDEIYDGYYTYKKNYRNYINTNDVYNIIIDDHLKMYYFTSRYNSLIDLNNQIHLKYSIFNFNETNSIILYKYNEEPWLRKKYEKKYLNEKKFQLNKLKNYKRIDHTTEIEIFFY